MDDVNLEEVVNAKNIVKQIVPDIQADSGITPSAFVAKAWTIYKERFDSNSNLNGKVFEAIIAISLVRKNIFPIYLQAKVAFIPGVNYDCIVYTQEIGPVSISAKTSLRERWKQADLEAVALKNIHRKSESYLVTLEPDEVRRRKADPSSVMALDDFILANSEEYDKLVDRLSNFTVIEAPSELAVSSNFVITSENYIDHF